MGARPRVALLTTSFPSWRGDPSGHFVEADARRRCAGGADVHVIAPGRASAVDESLGGEGIIVHRCGGGALFGWPGMAARARERPVRLLGGVPFGVAAARELHALAPLDRIVAHWIVPGAFPLALRRLPGRAAALEVVAHGADVRLLLALPLVARRLVIEILIGRGATFTFAAESLQARLCDALPGSLAGELIARSSIDAPPIEVASVRDAGSPRPALGLGDRARLAVFVGRLIADKRPELAIRAAMLAEDVTLVIVGDGPMRGALEAECDPRRVVFAGLVPRPRALAWIQAADVLIHPSASEAAPSCVREARLLGVPVVACAAGDVARWARCDEGIAIAEPTPRSLAEALRAGSAR